jgi:hypothetical protein
VIIEEADIQMTANKSPNVVNKAHQTFSPKREAERESDWSLNSRPVLRPMSNFVGYSLKEIPEERPTPPSRNL